MSHPSPLPKEEGERERGKKKKERLEKEAQCHVVMIPDKRSSACWRISPSRLPRYKEHLTLKQSSLNVYGRTEDQHTEGKMRDPGNTHFRDKLPAIL